MPPCATRLISIWMGNIKQRQLLSFHYDPISRSQHQLKVHSKENSKRRGHTTNINSRKLQIYGVKLWKIICLNPGKILRWKDTICLRWENIICLRSSTPFFLYIFRYKSFPQKKKIVFWLFECDPCLFIYFSVNSHFLLFILNRFISSSNNKG